MSSMDWMPVRSSLTRVTEVFATYFLLLAFMLATDVAARGLDFKGLDWVLQMDCPEDVETYIHRVGRTARYESNGRALLFLMPSENKMVELLKNKKIPIEQIKGTLFLQQ